MTITSGFKKKCSRSICSKEKCDKRAVYFLIDSSYCHFDGDEPKLKFKLCPDHAPQDYDPTPDQNIKLLELTFVEAKFEREKDWSLPLTGTYDKTCYVCGIEIEDINDFSFRSIKNSPIIHIPWGEVVNLCPIIEVEYYVCKNGCPEEEK